MNYLKIDSTSKLQEYMKKFDEKRDHVIALDIEAENNLHAYGEKLCLAQIFDGTEGVIIDPLKIRKHSLKLLFGNPRVLKVMYDAGSDLSLLKNAHNLEIKSILDLRPAVELLDYEKKDLHSVIAVDLGIVLEKKRKYQQYNWIKRPVSEMALEYALNDVQHLLALKDVMLAKLYARRLFEPFFLKNLQIQNKDYTRDPEDKYRKISGYSRLEPDKKAVFKKVFDVREKHAKVFNMPPHNVIRKTDLIKIVNNPDIIDTLQFIKRIDPYNIPHIVRDLKKAVSLS